MNLEDIKCIVHIGYDSYYGYGINEEVYDYITDVYGRETADSLLEIEYRDGDRFIYKLKNNDVNSRFDRILIDAFENGDDEFDSNYSVRTAEFFVDSYDGSESSPRLIFY